jgi:hypothetical protein
MVLITLKFRCNGIRSFIYLLQFIEIRALIVVVVVVVGHGNLQYDLHLNIITLKFSCIEIRAFIMQSMKSYGIFTLKCLALVLPSFTLDSVDSSGSVTS